MEGKEIICSAYRMTGGNNFYDGMITGSMPKLPFIRKCEDPI